MCNKFDDIQAYRVNISSIDIQYGTNQNGHYLIKLPFKINDGYVFVEKFELVNAGTLFNNINGVRVNCPSMVDAYSFYSDDVVRHTIEEIPFMSYVKEVAAGSQLYYKRDVTVNDIGYPIKSYDLDNRMLNITLTDELGDALTNAQITSWTMTLLFVDHKAEKETQ